MSFADRLQQIQSRIESASASVGRDPGGITLIAVSKSQPLEALKEAYDAGVRVFGESRLQEAIPKIEEMPDDIEWHFIGKLQSNKAKRVGELFSVVHTLESEAQLRELTKASTPVRALIEVNIAKERQKSGLLPQDLDDFVDLVINYPHVHLLGLMTIGRMEADPEETRSYFQEMKRLNESINGKWLSMGMSADFDVAIQEGATHVRVGSALFGDRAS